MALVIIVATRVLLLIVSEYKDRITAEELPKVIKEMIDHGKKISVLEKVLNEKRFERMLEGLSKKR